MEKLKAKRQTQYAKTESKTIRKTTNQSSKHRIKNKITKSICTKSTGFQIQKTFVKLSKKYVVKKYRKNGNHKMSYSCMGCMVTISCGCYHIQ